MECFRLLFNYLAWIEHQSLSGLRDSRKTWGMMRGMGGVRKSIHHSWLAKGLGLGLLCWGFVKVTYLGIQSAHERVWLVEQEPIWLPRACLTRGDLEPVRGNLHVCKFLRDLMNIQIRTVTAKWGILFWVHLPDERVTTQRRKEGRKEGENKKEREKEGRKENEGESEREGTANEREGESTRLNTPWN